LLALLATSGGGSWTIHGGTAPQARLLASAQQSGLCPDVAWTTGRSRAPLPGVSPAQSEAAGRTFQPGKRTGDTTEIRGGGRTLCRMPEAVAQLRPGPQELGAWRWHGWAGVRRPSATCKRLYPAETGLRGGDTAITGTGGAKRRRHYQCGNDALINRLSSGFVRTMESPGKICCRGVCELPQPVRVCDVRADRHPIRRRTQVGRRFNPISGTGDARKIKGYTAIAVDRSSRDVLLCH